MTPQRGGDPHPPWPGIGRAGSLVLPLRRDAFAAHREPCTVHDVALAPKAEWHVTLLDRRLSDYAARLQRADGPALEALRRAFEALDWRWRGTGERWLLREARAGGMAHSVIELLDMPAFGAFRRQAAQVLGTSVPRAPEHVTLYVAGEPRGIGVGSDAEFARLRVAPA